MLLFIIVRLPLWSTRTGTPFPYTTLFRSARIGGEEFAILLPDTTGGDAAALAERLRAGFAALPFATPSGAERYTASFGVAELGPGDDRSEEHTSELQSLMRISYAVFCLQKKNSITERQITCTMIDQA